MDKLEYAKQLISRLNYCLGENAIYEKEMESIRSKLPKWDYRDHTEYDKVFKNLTQKEKDIYYANGVRYSPSTIDRLRIELNTILLEIKNNK